jgi:cysteine desulfurase family protein (TIGR01976 family)
VASPTLRHRFPGIADHDWARFDGPAGTQMVDVAITAVAEWMASGSTAAAGGPFAAAQECAALLDRTRTTVGRLLGADPQGISFGPNSTTNVLALSRAVGATLRPGDRIVGTTLDHDSNVTPWRRAAEDAGASHLQAHFDPATGELDPDAVVALIDDRTRWVTVPGASNLLGTVPDLAPIVAAAHDVGARVFVDAVHLAPHRRVDVAALGVDALMTSPYKWYGPHMGVLYVEPTLRDSLPWFKVRPSASSGPEMAETGMPNFEGVAGVDAAARFLLEAGMDAIEAAEMEVFAPLWDGLAEIPGVTRYGVDGLAGRTPTAAFRVRGLSPDQVAAELAAARIAVWAGHNYAVDVVAELSLADTGGVVRAGVSCYTDLDDVGRLLDVVRRLAR